MRKHLCLLTVLFVVVADAAAACCSGCSPPFEERFSRASNVFVGRLVRLEETGAAGDGERPPAKRVLQSTIRVVEVFKGQPPTDGKLLVARDERGHPLSLVAFEYVFFLNDGKLIQSQDEAVLIANLPGDDLNDERKCLFEKLRELSRKEQR